MSSLLVTGATGFIGRAVLEMLARDDEEVHALSSQPQDAIPSHVTWHRADLGDDAAVARTLETIKPGRLLHLAWYVEHGRFWESPQNVVWVERSLQLMRSFARAGGERAVMVGTCAEYDWSRIDGALHETRSPTAPETLYGVAKDGLRRIGSRYAQVAGLEFAWARLFFLYGPHEAPGRLVSSVIRHLLIGDVVRTTSGTQKRDFLHVSDAARALVGLLDSRVVGPVNVASGEATAVSDVVDQIAKIIERPDLIDRGALVDRDGPSLLLADVARLRCEVGFQPSISLIDGLAETVAWWRAQTRTPTSELTQTS
jgi:nucleoside-diphosphate-sugar epimerase